MTDRIASIDAGRAIAMLAVVAIHAKPFAGLGPAGNAAAFTVDAIGRFAVPFFFLTAGYLFARKLGDAELRAYLAGYVSRVSSIYVFMLLLYAPLVLLLAAGAATIEGRSASDAVAAQAAAAVSPIEVLYYGTSVMETPWFLTALIVSIGLVSLFEVVGARRSLLAVALALHVVGLLGECYPMVLDVPVPTRDALFFGFWYTALGYWIGARGLTPRADRRRRYVAAFVLCSALAVVERYLLGYVVGDASIAAEIYTAEYSLATLLAAVSLFWFVLSTPRLGEGTPLARFGRYAVGIYVMHPLVLYSLVAAGQLLAMGGLPLARSPLWHLALTPVAYVGSFSLYLALARRGIVDPDGSHLPALGRVRRTARWIRPSP